MAGDHGLRLRQHQVSEVSDGDDQMGRSLRVVVAESAVMLFHRREAIRNGARLRGGLVPPLPRGRLLGRSVAVVVVLVVRLPRQAELFVLRYLLGEVQVSVVLVPLLSERRVLLHKSG